MKTAFAAALLAAAGFSNPAVADDWLPTAGLSASFGGAGLPHLAFSLGSAWLAPDALRPLPLTGLSYSSRNGADASLLGISVNSTTTILHADGSEGPSTWGWVGTTVAVIGTIALIGAAADGDDEDDEGGGGFNPQGCNGVGTNGIPGAGGEAVILGPDCEGLPEGGIRLP